jgi:tripartite-type tricarboxylate transporter receptor subunit TctC
MHSPSRGFRHGALPALAAAAGFLALMGCALFGALSPASAQDSYPSKPVRLVVGFPPGGGLDLIARLFADKMTAILGQPVVVENRGGAAGSIAGKQVAATAPDGHVILVASNSMVVNQIMNPKSGLDVENDLFGVASVAPQAIIIAVSPSLKVGSLKDLIALAQTRQLNFGTPGPGSIPHLLFEQFLSNLPGVKMTHVPFQGTGPALTAVMGGQIELASVTLPPAVSLVNANRVQGIAVTSAARSNALPKIPTTAESGFPAVVGTAWCGFFVPAKTPKAVTDRLSAVFLQVANMPDVKARLAKAGFEPTSTPGDQFRRELSQEIKTWTAVVEKIGLRKP